MAADSDSNNVRQRKPEKASEEAREAPAPSEKKTKKRSKKSDDDEVEYGNVWVDVLRVLTFLLFASCGLSYLVSGGESFFWSMKVPPKYMRVEWWKSQINGPLYLTPEELAAYDGTDESKPIYLAINGSIYDVTAGRRMYGPQGSYRFFAGTDAARGFVTGCFAEDRTADMRGVEEMYLPLDDAEVDSHFSSGELKALKEQEGRQAQKKAYDALKHWVNFFANSPKYTFIGYVKRDPDWLEKTPRRELCQTAQKARPKRKIPEEKSREQGSGGRGGRG